MIKRVLVVDDNRILCNNIANILQEEGYAVDCSYDGKSSFRLINDIDYDALVVDYKLPDISGWEILKLFCKKHKYPAAVIISAYADEYLKTRVARDNILLLDKPFSNKELISAINSMSNFCEAG